MFIDGVDRRSWGYPWTAVQVQHRDGLKSMAISQASRAALSPERVNFCPPVVTLGGTSKAAEADICEGVALMVERDERPDQSRAILQELVGLPTVVVKSGGIWVDPDCQERQEKCHVYWRLAEPTRRPEDHARLKEARVLASRIVSSDPTANPICHPVRWPGSWHKKLEPRLARIIELNPEQEVVLDDVLPVLEDAVRALGIGVKDDRPTTSPAPRVVNTDATWDVERDAAHIVSEYLSLSSGRHYNLYGYAVKIAMSALNAGYDMQESELHEIVRRLQDENPSPILAHKCQTITARDLKRSNKTAFQDNPGRLYGPNASRRTLRPQRKRSMRCAGRGSSYKPRRPSARSLYRHRYRMRFRRSSHMGLLS